MQLILAKAGTQIKLRFAGPTIESGRAEAKLVGSIWVPAFAGMSGGWGGVLHVHHGQPAQRNALHRGSTDDIYRRVFEHKSGDGTGFVRKYGVTRLVWLELHETRDQAFKRERRIKEWRRSWKLTLIEEKNPEWEDLYDRLPEILPF